MSIDETIAFLRSWQPSQGFFEANQEGLSRQLVPLVTGDPQAYAGRASEFQELDPTYVRGFFEGLTAALKSGKEFDWKEPLALAAWVTAQAKTIPSRKGEYFVADPDWSWTRNSIIEFVREGFVDRLVKLPVAERNAVWAVIEPLTKDPDPEPEREEKEDLDLPFLAINSTRGRALDLAIEYALWVANSDEAIKNTATKSFDSIPEVCKLLEEHLDTVNDHLLSIRSLYGKNFRQLAFLDWKWLQSNAQKIFPTTPDQANYFQAAWESYVVFCQPHPDLLKTFRWVYQNAVENIGAVKPLMRHPDEPGDRLGDHLITYYWWGELELTDSVLEGFFSGAPEGPRAHVIWYVAHSAAGWDAAAGQVLERLRHFFEFRLKQAEKQQAGGLSTKEFERELSSFGFWFTCGKFPEEWSIEKLVRVARLTKKIEPSMTVLQHLPSSAPVHHLPLAKLCVFFKEGERLAQRAA